MLPPDCHFFSGPSLGATAIPSATLITRLKTYFPLSPVHISCKDTIKRICWISLEKEFSECLYRNNFGDLFREFSRPHNTVVSAGMYLRL
jgi:hypothetical protein